MLRFVEKTRSCNSRHAPVREQVRKLAGWGLTQNDIASFVGWSQSLISPRF